MESVLVTIDQKILRRLSVEDLNSAQPRDVMVWVDAEAERRECPQWSILQRIIGGLDEYLFIPPERFCASVIESFRFRSRFPHEKNFNILRFDYSDGTLKMVTDSVYYILVDCVNPFWGERTSCTYAEFTEWKKENESRYKY